MAITKPPVLPAWAESGDRVTPSNAEIQVGWPLSSIPPSRQRFNWLLNYLANAVRYFSRRGIPDYDAAETYMIGDRIIGDDGKTYRSLIDTNLAQTPSTSPTKWEEWAPTLARFAALIQGQTYTAFTTAGAAPNFTLTPSPAITAYAAGQRFRVKFHAIGAGADQLNVSALGNKALKQYDSTGAKVAAVPAANQLADVEYDGVDMVLLDPLPPTPGMTQAAADARYAGIGYIQGQTYTAFTTAGAAPNFTLTPSPAITAYTAGQRFRVKFHAVGAGADQLNVSALGNKALKQYDSTGAKVAAVPAANQLADVEYDGVDMVLLDPLPPAVSVKQIQPITASVAANALTLTLNPTALDFRNSALNSGVVNTRTVSAAISLIVPSAATLGTVSATAARLALLAIDNAGTVELAVVNLTGGNNLDETTLISTTAISAAATANNVVYSTAARASVPFRVVGFIDITEAAAGTWATDPTTIQGIGGQALAALSSLGYGQTWQSVSRTPGTTYYNTTGKPIVAVVQGGTTMGGSITVNGQLVARVDTGNPTPSQGSCNAIVPPGASYVYSVYSAYAWSAYELR